MEFFYIFKDKIGNYLPKKHRRKKVILCIHIEVGKVISAKFFHVICLNCPILVAKWRKTWFCQQQQGEGETVCMCTFSRFCSLQFHFALRSAVRNERALDITLLHWEKQSTSQAILHSSSGRWTLMRKNCLRSNKCLILRYLGISKSFKFCKIEIYFGNIRQLVHRLLICNYIFFCIRLYFTNGMGAPSKQCYQYPFEKCDPFIFFWSWNRERKAQPINWRHLCLFWKIISNQ